MISQAVSTDAFRVSELGSQVETRTITAQQARRTVTVTVGHRAVTLRLASLTVTRDSAPAGPDGRPSRERAPSRLPPWPPPASR